MDIADCLGKAVLGSDGIEYGLIRLTNKPYPDELVDIDVLAEDECGNYFLLINARIYFWDHETGVKTEIAKSLGEFKKSCFKPADVSLNEDDISSAWIDPEFAKERGIKQ